MPAEPPARCHAHPRCSPRRAPDRQPAANPDGVAPYAELHCLSNFSFLRGASHPEELIDQAAALDYSALAITDRNSLAGVVRAHVAWKKLSRHAENATPPRPPLKLIIGAEITPCDALPLVILAPDRNAYGRLCRLITRGRLRCAKGECEIRLADIDELCRGSGLIAIMSTERAAAGPARADARAQPPDLSSSLDHYRRVFGDALYLAARLECDVPDAQRLAELAALSGRTGLPLVAANAVLYHVPERRYLQDVLTCIREKCSLAEAGSRLQQNAERHLRTRDEIERRYAPCCDARLADIGRAAVARTIDIAARCSFTLDELKYEYPHELVPSGRAAIDYLEELVWRGAAEIYGAADRASGGRRGCAAAPTPDEPRGRCPAPPSDCAMDGPHDSPGGVPHVTATLLRAELALIRELRYEHFFLTVYDVVRYARSRRILCQGRGSAANSAVCYCLGITAVDPAKHDLLFERFISRERNEPPDIDVDFEHERREEVFQYIYQKYGRERAAITAEVITYRPRSALRDVGKALGLSLDLVDVLARSVDWFDDQPLPAHALKNTGVDPDDRTIQMLGRLVRQILGFPRHLSQHVGGFVITETPLCEIVPLENGAMPDRTFIEWDKDDIDALGILKVDCLALGMLTALSKCFALLAKQPAHASSERGRQDAPAGGAGRPHEPPTSPARFIDPLCALRSIPDADPDVYDMICRADTVGVFQIESRAQMSMLPRLKPRSFYDLVIEVAIVRPGPIQGGMVHPFLRRRDGLERVAYPSDDVRRVLHKTLGVPIFQEQVMRLAVVAAGFTPGEADQLRRAMAAWRRGGDIQKFQIKLIQGMLANGYTREFAEQIYRQILGFGEYGFPESHSASFAILVYASAWLKRRCPAAFCAAMLNSQPLGFYTPGQLIRDASAHGVEVRPVDATRSSWNCTLESGTRNPQDPALPSEPAGWGAGGPALRLGFRLIRGLSEEKLRGLIAARGDPPAAHASPIPLRPLFSASLSRLAAATRVSRETLLRLAAADAFRSLGLGRRQALWHILALDRDERLRRPDGTGAPASLFADLDPDEPPLQLPAMALEETVVQDYDALGFSLNAHPLGLVRAELERISARPRESRTDKGRTARGAASGAGRARISSPIFSAAALRTLRHGARAAVAGLVTVRQRPGTAKGMVFMTLEDETGMANLVIRPNIWERERRVARGCLALVAEGVIERQGEVIHLMSRRFHDLADVLAGAGRAQARLSGVSHQSRDFH